MGRVIARFEDKALNIIADEMNARDGPTWPKNITPSTCKRIGIRRWKVFITGGTHRCRCESKVSKPIRVVREMLGATSGLKSRAGPPVPRDSVRAPGEPRPRTPTGR